jgi:hypothetical protein
MHDNKICCLLLHVSAQLCHLQVVCTPTFKTHKITDVVIRIAIVIYYTLVKFKDWCINSLKITELRRNM